MQQRLDTGIFQEKREGFMTTQATRDRILLAAISAIEKNGIGNLTTRVIADEAGVNNAALHYYFGTKELLLELALTSTLKHWIEDTTEILTEDVPIKKRLRSLFEYLIDGVLRYPNLIRAHIRPALMEGFPDTSFLQMLAAWVDRSVVGLMRDVDHPREEAVRLAMQSAVYTVLVIGLLPEADGLTTSQKLSDPDFQSFLVEYLIQSILHASHYQ